MTLLCRIRQCRLANLPEEVVRQRLLSFLIDSLGYPASLIQVEAAIPQVPRRLDILCSAPGPRPLLLVECKAVPITLEVERQVIGYNVHVKAPFIVLANASELKTGWVQGDKLLFSPGIPSFTEAQRTAFPL